MRAVVQRAGPSRVEVDGKIVGEIEKGLVAFIGIGESDEEKDCRYIADKIAGLRIFEDGNGKMSLSVEDVGGEILCISQFTLYGDLRKGRRPSFAAAADLEKGAHLYKKVCAMIKEKGLRVEEGVFQAMMRVFVDNDGPVTILLDSEKKF